MTHNPQPDLSPPHADRRRTVFISYSHDDESHARRLIGDLEAAGHACWIDTTAIKGGEEWVKVIAEGINNSYALVPIITENARRSEWMMKEILWAQKKKLRIIPWALEDLMSADEFILLVNCQWVTLFEGDYAAALEKLLAALEKIPRALPSPALPGAETGASSLGAAGARSPRRKAEWDYLESLQLKKLASDRYTPVGGDSQQRMHRVEMPQTFELLKLGKLREERRRFDDTVEEICRRRRAARRTGRRQDFHFAQALGRAG